MLPSHLERLQRLPVGVSIELKYLLTFTVSFPFLPQLPVSLLLSLGGHCYIFFGFSGGFCECFCFVLVLQANC